MSYRGGDQAGVVRRKRHPIRNAIIVLVFLGLLGGSGYVVANSLARNFATQFVQTGVAQQLDTSSSQVRVNLGSAAILPQILKKHLTKLTVTVGSFTSGTLSGSAVFDARNVPLNTTDPASSIGVTVRVPAAGLASLVASTSGDSQATVQFAGSALRISTTKKVQGKKVPVTVDFAPSVSGTTLVLTPTRAAIGTKSYTPAALRKSQYASLVSGLIAVRHVCLASGLPKAMQISSIVVADERLVVTAGGVNLPLGSLSSRGTCPAT